MFSVLVVLLLMFSSVPVALAYSGDISPNGGATPFKVTYLGPTTWTCAGARVVNRVSVKDSERCVISGYTTGFVPGTYSGDPTGNFPPYGTILGWFSDYDGAIATHWTITISDNGDGTFTADIVAYY